MPPPEGVIREQKIAYFTMECGILSQIPTYAVQLGEEDRAELCSLCISDQLLHAWAMLHCLAAETFIRVKLVKLIALPTP